MGPDGRDEALLTNDALVVGIDPAELMKGDSALLRVFAVANHVESYGCAMTPPTNSALFRALYLKMSAKKLEITARNPPSAMAHAVPSSGMAALLCVSYHCAALGPGIR